MMNGDPIERSSSIAAQLGIVAAIFGCIPLLLAMGCLWYLSVLTAQIGSEIQQALASSEFQEQLVVLMVFYVIAAALVIAWNHFESLFDAPDAVVQAVTSASSLFDCSNSMF